MSETFTGRTFTTVEEAVERAQWRADRAGKPHCVRECGDRFIVSDGPGGLVDVWPLGTVIDHRPNLKPRKTGLGFEE